MKILTNTFMNMQTHSLHTHALKERRAHKALLFRLIPFVGRNTPIRHLPSSGGGDQAADGFLDV